MSFRKLFSIAVSLLIIAVSPGIQPYRACASQFSSSRAASSKGPAAPISFAGAALRPTLGATGLGSAIVAPPTVAPTGASAAANPAMISALRPVALARLSLGAAVAENAAAPTVSPERGAAAIDELFHGSAVKPSLDLSAPLTGQQSSAPAQLSPAGSPRGGVQAPQGQDRPSEPPAPRQSLSRSMRVGLIATVLPLVINFVAAATALAFGYEFHPSYGVPTSDESVTPAPLVFAASAVIMAPIAEEMLFRGGLMGGIRKLTNRIPKLGQFWIPAALSSVVFVAAHELSDPVLFSTRFAHSMIISYVFHKEGYAGSIFAHAFFNGLLVVPMLVGALLPLPLAVLAILSMVPLIALLTWKAWRKTRAEAPEVKAGRLTAYEIGPVWGFAFVALLAAGFFLLMPNIFWPAGAVGWLLYGWRKFKAADAL